MEREFEYIVNAAIESKFKPKHGSINGNIQNEMKKMYSIRSYGCLLVVMSYYQKVLLLEMLKTNLQIVEIRKRNCKIKRKNNNMAGCVT